MSDNEQPQQAPSEARPTSAADAGGEGRRKGGPAYYYGRQPAYYYGSGGGQAGYGGAGYYGGGGTGEAAPEEDSFLGSLSVQRILRVTLQKWPTLLVSVLLGLGGGFAYFKTAPVIYRATSTIEMSVRPRQYIPGPSFAGEDLGSPSDEIFNTRLVKLRSRAVIDMVAERVRAEFPNLGLTDDEMYTLLFGSVEMALRRRSKLVDISARHTRPEVAQAIANAYAITAENYSLEENRASSESAVAYLKTTAEQRRRQVEKADQTALDFRVANQIDVMENQKLTIDSVLQQINSSLADSESEESKGVELLSVLNAIRENPEKAGSLPESVPRSAEIAAAQQTLQNVIAERDALLLRYTPKHPEVLEKENSVAVARRQYSDAVGRARETAGANLELLRKQIESLRRKKSENEQSSSDLEVRIVGAKMNFDALKRESSVSETIYGGVLRRMEEAQLAADQSATTTKVVEPAVLPRRQISPVPSVAFSTGPGLGLLFGFLFVLIIDRLEDRITGSSDIESRMATKVLALIPHVPRAKRDVLALMSAARKFSRLAEAFAGLRSLLDSPRYSELSHSILVISTQPEEGKTITSCNLALAYALAGRKTVLVDFDLRRPRVARVFGIRQQEPPSLVHALDAGDPAAFETLAVASGHENLDLITSRSSNHISPSGLMGSAIVAEFIKWAGEHYDRVVIDSPPFGLVSDSVVLGTLAGCVVVVCRPDRSRYRSLRHAVRHFTESGARVLGVVVNDVDFGRSAYFSNYDYHTYGYSYGYKYNKYGRYYSKIAEDRDANPATIDALPPAEDDDGESKPPPESVLDVDDDE